MAEKTAQDTKTSFFFSGLFKIKNFFSLIKIIPVIVLCCTLSLSLLLWIMLSNSYKQKAQVSFNSASDNIVQGIIGRMHDHEQFLLGGVGLFNTKINVSRADWRRYISTLQLERNLPGISGVGYTIWLNPAEKESHIRSIRAEGFPEYIIRPEGKRSRYTSIIYLEPFNWRNQRAFGYDMYTEPTRRSAMNKAIDEGITTIAAKIILVQETENDQQSGMLMYAPVFQQGMPIDSAELRRKALRGFVYSPIRINDFIYGTFGKLPQDLAFELYPDETPTPHSLMFNSIHTEKTIIPEGFTPIFTSQIKVEAYGRTWVFSFKSLPSFVKYLEKEKSTLALVIGILVSFLLSFISFLLLNTRNKAVILAKEMTIKVKEREETLSLLLNSTAEAIYGIDLNGNCTFCNGACLEILGYSSQEELLGKNMHDQIHHTLPNGKHFPIADCHIFKAFQLGQRSHVEDEFLWRKDGTSFPAEYWSYPQFFNGKIIGAVVTFIDITERKKSEERSNELSTRLILATQAGGVGIWDYDIKNNTLTWDDQMLSLYGINKLNFSGAYESWQLGLHPEDRKRGNEEIQWAIAGTKDFNTEFRVIWPDGSIHNIRALAIVLRDENGHALRMIGTNWDITKQKEEQAELQKANSAKSEFVAHMSHEIRTPLNAVIGFTDLLQKTALNDIQQSYVSNVNIAAISLLDIINDILDLSKIEAGKLELDFIKTDMIELIEQSADIIKYSASKKGLEFLLNIHPDVPRYAVVDPVRLKQILINLLSNAVKFTTKGEVELQVFFTPKTQTTGEFHFSVRDTGIGISEQQKNKIFKAFSQGDSSTTRKFGGTGLGLIISNLLAEKMGSRIELNSEAEKGSVFFFTLSTEFEAWEQLEFKSLKEIKRILVIDDNANNRMILEHTLNHWGISSTSCDSGLSALKMIDADKSFDAIIVDYNMPQMNGIDTIKMLREKIKSPQEQQPAVLLYSSSDNIEILNEAKELGVKFNLVKPVKSHELFYLLKNIRSELTLKFDKIEPQISDSSGEISSPGAPIILIAEDVELNMLLVKALIQELIPNAQIIEAKNGKECLASMITKKPDIILMDNQMPEMDGIEATKQIRRIEVESGGHIPIIALTAGITKEEIKKSLNAGMDDYLTKPIHPEKFKKMLEMYLLNQDEKEKKLPEENSKTNETIHFDKKSLIKRLENNFELFKEMIKIIPSQISSHLISLKEGISQNNPKKIKFSAHALKGIALEMNFNLLADLAFHIEAQSEQGKTEEMDEILETMVSEWEILQTLIQMEN